jgi:hypothetical protein
MPMPPARRTTPIGVAILGVLTILSGLALLAVGGLLVVAAFFVGVSVPYAGVAGAFLGVIGAVFLIFAIIAMAAGVGLIRLRSWAWWLTMIVAVLTLLGSLPFVAAFWFLTAFELLLIIYLVIVKKHFGRPAGM